MNCLSKGILAVLSRLILATEKEKKEIVLLTMTIDDKEIRLLPVFV